MHDKTVIYGKSSCPFTLAAIDDHKKKGIDCDYIDVIENPEQLEAMLRYSKGDRKIPVIVTGNHVTIGFNGKG